MTVEILYPTTREEWLDDRKPTLGGTETPMMLGVHPHVTPFELWARKSDFVPGEPDNKFLRRGRILEPIVVDLIREERPDWIVTPNIIGEGGKFYRDLEEGTSCTPDTFIKDPDREGTGNCEIKTLDTHVFRQDWMIDGEIHLPPYVAIQAIQEAHLTGASWCCVAALVGFNLDLHIIDVKIHAGVIARIKREVPDFLRRIRENDPPPPDYAKDGATIAALYDEDDGGTIDLAHLEVEPYTRLLKLVAHREAMKRIQSASIEAEKERKTIDAELIHMLGNATRGTLADGRVIEAKTIRRNGFTVEPTSYRTIKVKHQKEKAA